jgi:hypothetical protein
MAIIKTRPYEKVINGNTILSSEILLISEKEYRTKGEGFIIVKDIPNSKIILDHSTTDHITIKALTKVLILPSIGRIDEEFDEVLIDKGACVEFIYSTGNWYIVSSDGLKQS